MNRDADPAISALMKPMKREDVTDLIAFRRMKQGVKWADVAQRVGQSKEWTTAACLGQMQMTKLQAETVGRMFDLPEEAVLLLQSVPYKGSLPTAVPTDPLIYRLYELVSVYGTTIKELIHEEFGDGIMSAIDELVRLGERRLPADERLPGDLLAFAPALRHEFHALRIDGQHVRLAVDLDFALERFVELRRHRLRNSLTSSGI